MATILIVDDQRLNREYLAAILEDQGHRLLAATDGAQALEVLRRERPDLVISDILMPAMDGYELLRQMRGDPAISQTPMLFYTAHYHEKESLALARLSGAVGVLTKGCNPDVVLSSVQAALSRDPRRPAPPVTEDFDREHLRLLTDKLSQKANELRKANERLTALINLGLDFGSECDSGEVLQSFCQAAREIIGAEYAMAGILAPSSTDGGPKLRYFFTSGMDAEIAAKLGAPDPRQGGVRTVLRDARSFRLHNPCGDPAAVDFPSSYPPFRSWLGAPIVSGGRVLGWLGLLDKVGAEMFSIEDERLACTLAAQVGRIHENSSLYADMRRHAAELELEVAERKRAEASLKESEERFRQLAETIREVFWLSDPVNGKILYISPAYETVWGRPCETLYNSPLSWLEAIHVEDRERVREAFLTKQVVGRYDEAYRITRPDGSVRWIHDRGFPVRNTAGEVYRVAGVAEDITERKRAAEDLQGAQLRLQHVISFSPAVLFTMSTGGGNQVQGVNWISENLREVLGHSPEAALNPAWWRENVHPDDWDKVVVQFRSDLLNLERSVYEHRIRHADGSYRWIHSELRLIRDRTGQAMEIIGSLSDVTERKQLEDQFRQAQKMEAVGRLAGGVAHDFNNLLTVISGYGELVLDRLSPADPIRALIREMVTAGHRAAGLTRQLLTFSRKAIIEPKILDLKAVVVDVDKMLRRILGEDIQLTVVSDPELGAVKADPGQIEQVLLNLAINARDAMPQGGQLTIEVRNADLDETYAREHPDACPGRHVLLAVSDTGCGMDQATMGRIFEPFFSTKGEQGTGLGLATVHGIVKQSGGHVAVYSELGQGTAFKVYLPRVEQRAPGVKSRFEPAQIPRGSETVLLVEDEDGVRALIRHALQSSGYTVLEARNGSEALQVAGQQGRIDLLVTDVVMPRMGGREVAERLAALYPGVKVLFLSGYTDDAVVRHGILEAEVAFLQKPFSPASLAAKVREVLDQS